MTAVWIFLGMVVATALWVILTFNKLVRLHNRVQNAWKQIGVQLRRRHDLIPDLVEAVKGYMQFERDTLESVIAARAKAVATTEVRDSAQAEGGRVGRGMAAGSGQVTKCGR